MKSSLAIRLNDALSREALWLRFGQNSRNVYFLDGNERICRILVERLWLFTIHGEENIDSILKLREALFAWWYQNGRLVTEYEVLSYIVSLRSDHQRLKSLLYLISLGQPLADTWNEFRLNMSKDEPMRVYVSGLIELLSQSNEIGDWWGEIVSSDLFVPAIFNMGGWLAPSRRQNLRPTIKLSVEAGLLVFSVNSTKVFTEIRISGRVYEN